MPPVRLLRPALGDVPPRGPGALVDLDPAQAQAVAAGADPDGGSVVVLGAPGTGKTTVVVETALRAAAHVPADQILVLTATRRAAADLRDRIASRIDGARPTVRTPAALAFSVLRTKAARLGTPGPVLVSGPEQDAALAELLAGHAAGEGRDPGWPEEIDPVTVGLSAFRAELRDLIMRAAERGIDPHRLAVLGRRHHRPAWVAAAHVYEEYLATWALRATTPDVGARLDPAVVVDEAVMALVGWDKDLPGVARPRWTLVLVDDHQESTVATTRLLRVLADDGARLLLAGDPDAAVQTFRGALPLLVARASARGDGAGELGASQVVLGTHWRSSEQIRAVTAAVTSRIRTSGVAAHRTAGAAPGAADDASSVEVAILPSTAQEHAWVAHRLRTAHVDRGVPWPEMAVITRTGARVVQVRRALAAAGVPSVVVGTDVALRDEPACRPLLDALAIVAGRTDVDDTVAAALLTGPLGGLDPLGVRAVRRALRTAGDDGLLADLLGPTDDLPTIPDLAARSVERLRRVLDAGRQESTRAGSDAASVLWALWSESGLGEQWQQVALAGGAAGDRADHDLDAVLALFAAADRYVARAPQSGAGAFVEWISSQDLPADSLAARGARDGVAILTPAGAAGREWTEVVVLGVQDGVWPDLRLRDSLLGAQGLVDLVAGRLGDAPGEPRAAVMADELRSFAVACSRPRERLVVTAVADQDQGPSMLVDLVEPPPDDGPDPRVRTAPAPHDLRGVVARLRQRLERAHADGSTDPAAARLLARLAQAGAPGAHPDQWQGLRAPSTRAPLWGPGERVQLSPSKLETADRCAVRWAFEQAGGRGTDTSSADLGTMIHEVAAAHPTGTRTELRAALDEMWGPVSPDDGWAQVSRRRRAEAMVDRLAGYLSRHDPPLAVEKSFTLRTDRVVLHGQVDRLEAGGSPGEVVVVDLKTGAPPSKAEARHHAQLGAYQLAVDAGALGPGLTSAGARLVHLSSGASGAVREQNGLKADSWAAQLLDQVADAVAGPEVRATENDGCRTCAARRCCPARPEGRQVVAR